MPVDDEFIVYLVSNVSTDIFPNNAPAKFSTILAEDIHLEGGNWEVAVKNIIYPTHVASTTDEDKLEIYQYTDEYRNLYPQPKREDYNENLSNGLTYEVPLTGASDDGLTLGETIVNMINKDLATKKLDKIMKFEARVKNEDCKIIFHVYPTDFFVFLDPNLREYLGFEKNEPFTKGSHWAWSAFDAGKRAPAKSNRQIFISDLQSHVQEQLKFVRSFEYVPIEVNDDKTKKEKKKTEAKTKEQKTDDKAEGKAKEEKAEGKVKEAKTVKKATKKIFLRKGLQE